MKCPKCGTEWDGGSIFDTFREQEWSKDMTDDELNKFIKASYLPPYRWDERLQIKDRLFCPACTELKTTTI